MSRMLKGFCLAALTLCLTPCWAWSDCRTRVEAHRAAIRLQLPAGVTVVPFAVPVAVPVAPLVQPTVIYQLHAVGASSARQGSAFTQQGAPDAETVDAAVAAVGLMRTRCARCHQGSGAKGELAIFDDGAILLEHLPRRRILEAAEQGSMPLDGPRLSEQELEWLRAWATPPRDLVW